MPDLACRGKIKEDIGGGSLTATALVCVVVVVVVDFTRDSRDVDFALKLLCPFSKPELSTILSAPGIRSSCRILFDSTCCLDNGISKGVAGGEDVIICRLWIVQIQQDKSHNTEVKNSARVVRLTDDTNDRM